MRLTRESKAPSPAQCALGMVSNGRGRAAAEAYPPSAALQPLPFGRLTVKVTML